MFETGPIHSATRAALAAIGLVCLAACGFGGEHAVDATTELQPCHLKGLSESVLCGTHEVFENRVTRQGRRIRLNIAVIPAIAASPAPDPLFVLAGGPGQAATDIGPVLLPFLKKVRADRDIVLVDQRGTGASNPLDCPEDLPDGAAAGESESARELKRMFRAGYEPGLLEVCLEHLDADTRLYTTPIAMDDLDDVRRALGYTKINLYGASYGTRAALVYMRRHPDAVRAVVLDGAAPPALKVPLNMAPDGERALRLVMKHCADDPDCHEAHPDLEAQLDRILQRLSERPQRRRIRHPRTGETVDLTITHDAFVGQLRTTLYDPDLASLLPLVLERADAGDFDPFIALGATMAEGVTDAISLGMFLSVICAEDIPFITDADRRAALPGTFLGAVMLDAIVKACADWPAATMPPGYTEPVRSDLPTLILSGALDPATPPRWGDEVAGHLSRSAHLIDPGAGHNVLPRGCAREIVARFIESGTVDDLDATCLESSRRPPFFLNASGPRP